MHNFDSDVAEPRNETSRTLMASPKQHFSDSIYGMTRHFREYSRFCIGWGLSDIQTNSVNMYIYIYIYIIYTNHT